MAAGIFNEISSRQELGFNAQSAGIYAGYFQNATKEAIAVCQEHGIDISMHTSRPISIASVESFDVAITMTQSQKEFLVSAYPSMEGKAFMASEWAMGIVKDVDDPYGGGVKMYEDVFDELSYYICEAISVSR
ncbi:MAG: hypothetical protein FWG10_09880 [Eubacteriaceae bacterium]|nr:hypothetical protein [Eubacteriaceae bacterium]